MDLVIVVVTSHCRDLAFPVGHVDGLTIPYLANRAWDSVHTWWEYWALVFWWLGVIWPEKDLPPGADTRLLAERVWCLLESLHIISSGIFAPTFDAAVVRHKRAAWKEATVTFGLVSSNVATAIVCCLCSGVCIDASE